MNKQQGLFNLLTSAADEIEKDLMKNYSDKRVITVIKKLRHVIEDLHCKSDEKSVGIFVSPLTEKVYYFTATDQSKTYFPPVLVRRNILHKS